MQRAGLIRYGLEMNDPLLGELIRRVDAGETINEINFSQLAATSDADSSQAKIKALTDLICRAGEEVRALLFFLATLENAAHLKALANTAKHFAFTHCDELNCVGMVDAQIAVIETEAANRHTNGVIGRSVGNPVKKTCYCQFEYRPG